MCTRCFFRQELTSKDRYPNNISPATAVPAWAYLDVVTADTFDPVNATRAVSLPESTVGNIELSTRSSISSSISKTQTNAPLPSTSYIYGPLVTPAMGITMIGVIVGGIIGFIITATLIVYIVKKRKGQLLSARTSATPSMAAAAGFRPASQHPSTLFSGGYISSNQGQNEPPLPSPWSPA